MNATAANDRLSYDSQSNGPIKSTTLPPKTKPATNGRPKALFGRILGAVVLLVALATVLGRGVTWDLRFLTVKVEPKAPIPVVPLGETFGPGSPIAASGGHAEVTVTGAPPSAPRAASESSSAIVVTHGAASPIAVGPGSRASATMTNR